MEEEGQSEEGNGERQRERRLPKEQRRAKGKPFTLGFFSHDFNDHPTGHMVEAVFKVNDPRFSLSQHQHYLCM